MKCKHTEKHQIKHKKSKVHKQSQQAPAKRSASKASGKHTEKTSLINFSQRKNTKRSILHVCDWRYYCVVGNLEVMLVALRGIEPRFPG